MRTLLQYRGSQSVSFWEVRLEQSCCSVRTGPLGTLGREQRHLLPNAELAAAWALASVAERRCDGWVETPTHGPRVSLLQPVLTEDDTLMVERLLAEAQRCVAAGFKAGEEYEDSAPHRYHLSPRAGGFYSARALFAAAEAHDSGATALTAHAEWVERCEDQFGRIVDDTAELYRLASARAPRNRDLQQRLAFALQRRGDDTRAIARFDLLLTEAPNEALLHFLRALSHRQLGHLDQALLDVEHAIALQPADARFVLLRARLNTRRAVPTAEPLDDVRLAVELCDSVDMRKTLGDWLKLRNRFAEAAAEYSIALARDPHNAAAFNARAYCLHRMGKPAEAEADEERYKELKGKEEWVAEYRRRSVMWRGLQASQAPTPELGLTTVPPTGARTVTREDTPMPRRSTDEITQSHRHPRPTRPQPPPLPPRPSITAAAPQKPLNDAEPATTPGVTMADVSGMTVPLAPPRASAGRAGPRLTPGQPMMTPPEMAATLPPPRPSAPQL